MIPGVLVILLLNAITATVCADAENSDTPTKNLKSNLDKDETLKTAQQQRLPFNYNGIQNPFYAGQQNLGFNNNYQGLGGVGVSNRGNYDVANLLFPNSIANNNPFGTGQQQGLGYYPGGGINPFLNNFEGGRRNPFYQGVVNGGRGGRLNNNFNGNSYFNGFRPSNTAGQFGGYSYNTRNNISPFGTTNGLLYQGQDGLGQTQNGYFRGVNQGVGLGSAGGIYGNQHPTNGFGSVRVGSGIQVGPRGNASPSRGNTGFIANPYGRQHSYFDPNVGRNPNRNSGASSDGAIIDRPSYSVLSGGIYSNRNPGSGNINSNIPNSLADRRPAIGAGGFTGFSSSGSTTSLRDSYPLHNPSPFIGNSGGVGPSGNSNFYNFNPDNNGRGASLYYRQRRRPGEGIRNSFPKSDEE